ncbi:helix-turn-helix domain-containing protein [Mobiluncus mulieris]|uniref:Helix-turn-helix domain-containing protein n=1 Tax=Mobiluncus mulieris TaxID=2052 RepID=A0A7Y0U2X5_9ACTO|nr:helix-turn-helix domain-containing protein [Mobiluncus mulieris]NMW66010.1 helix-turn-helix domain-containing protein [Mobiluncus mulieris]
MTSQLIDVEAAAELLAVSKWTVYRAIDTGQIPAHRIGRHLRLDPGEILAATATKPPPPKPPTDPALRDLLRRTRPKKQHNQQ